MAGVRFGNHSAVRVARKERGSIRNFDRDVLGCEIARELDVEESTAKSPSGYRLNTAAPSEGRHASSAVSALRPRFQ